MMEKKFVDTKVTGGTVLTQAGIFLPTTGGASSVFLNTIVDIAQNTSEKGRIGRKCTITDIHMKLWFDFTSNASASATVGASEGHEQVRIMLFWDKQCNGTAATALQLLETDDVTEYRNLANKMRFRILYDKTFNWNANKIVNGNAASNDVDFKQYFVKINKKVFIPIEYNNASSDGALATIRSNNIGMIIWAERGDQMATRVGRIRVRFIDY